MTEDGNIQNSAVLAGMDSSVTADAASAMLSGAASVTLACAEPAPTGADPVASSAADSRCGQHAKPLLAVDQQIAHMKSKGITFELCSEEDAAEHLRTKCQFFRIYSYRKLFERRIGGSRDGQYVNLDFGHLLALSDIDRRLRDVLLPMALNVEHFAKVRLLTAAEDRNEDGYAIVRDYRKSVSDTQRAYIDSELDHRKNDSYVGAIICRYRDNMPIWAFCEVVPFGMFTGLVKFCADRWGDAELKKIHYLLKCARSVRNACAHGACGVNGLADAEPRMRPSAFLVNELTAAGVPKRLRVKWLRGARMVQICTTLYLYAVIVPAGETRTERAAALAELFSLIRSSRVPVKNPAMAALLFIECLTKAVGLLE